VEDAAQCAILIPGEGERGRTLGVTLLKERHTAVGCAEDDEIFAE
jgi:hypothetical protein